MGFPALTVLSSTQPYTYGSESIAEKRVGRSGDQDTLLWDSAFGMHKGHLTNMITHTKLYNDNTNWYAKADGENFTRSHPYMKAVSGFWGRDMIDYLIPIGKP